MLPGKKTQKDYYLMFQDIIRSLDHIKMRTEDQDSLIVAILSHGDEKNIYGSDGMPVKVIF